MERNPHGVCFLSFVPFLSLEINVSIVADYHIQVQINGSSPQWDNLENGVYSEKKILRFTSNDSMSVFQENQKIHNIGDEPQTEERHLR